MNRVGEANGFFICYPNGIDNAWNVGWAFGSEADDVGFTAAMIDRIAGDYEIDEQRVYACGMSNGGFMSYQLACELSDRITAIASVTGSMSPVQAMDCQAGRPVSVLQFHGTNDGTVPYQGLEDLNIGIDSVFNYWSSINNCGSDIDTIDIEDSNMNDGSTAQRISLSNCESNTEVVLYKIDKGEHTWPGAFLSLGVTNQDIEASELIWEFFRDKTLSNQTTSIVEKEITTSTILYPNPTTDFLFIESKTNWTQYQVFDLNGRLLMSGNINIGNIRISTEGLLSGTYILSLKSKDEDISKRFNVVR